MAQLAALLGCITPAQASKAARVDIAMLLHKAIDQRVLLDAYARKNLDTAAHSAATSPLNLRPQPTEGQRSAGNYRKGHVKFAGLDISIENPAGSLRRPEWPTMQAHYGYVRGTTGADGDHVDVFLRPSTPIDWDGDAYVIDQVDKNGAFDEHKVMLGYDSQTQAVRAYLSHYPRGWNLGYVTVMSLDELRDWLSTDALEPVQGVTVDKTALYGLLGKEWSQSASATSGITAYSSSKRRLKSRSKSK